MRRAILLWSLGAGGALLLAVLLLLYTPPGLRLVGRLAEPLSGGQVRVEGLGGFFPNHLRVVRLEVADSQGVWLRVEQASLDWSALALMGNHVAVENVSAARVVVMRRPISAEESSGETPRIDIGHLSLPRIDLAPPVIGHAATLNAAGSLHYVSLHRMEADLLVTRAGSGDRYRIAGGVEADVAHGSATIREGVDGILGKLAGLPGLGPVNLSATATGTAANSLVFGFSAGPLRADGHGTIALASRRADLDVVLTAPAMTPRPGIGWQALLGQAHVHGSFDAPRVDAHLLLAGGTVQGVTAGHISLDVTGDAGHVALTGLAEKVILPGSHPGLIAAAPVRLEAQADLRAAARPVRFALTHPLAQLHGVAQTRGPLTASADLVLPALAPLASLAGTVLNGDAALHLLLNPEDAGMRIALDGRLNANGNTLPARLLGRSVLTATATVRDGDLVASHLRLKGAAVTADAEGSLRRQRLNYRLAFDLGDLSRLAKTLQGSLTLRGNASGPLNDVGLVAGGSATLATQGFARRRVDIDLKAEGLPAFKNATMMLDGRLDDAPLSLRAAWHGGRARQARLTARWRSLDARADIAIGAGSAWSGKAQLALPHLADITSFTGVALSGAADATVTLRPRGAKTDAAVTAALHDLRAGAASLDTASLRGRVGDVMGAPQFDLALILHRIAVQGWMGDAQGRVQGPVDRLAVSLESAFRNAAAAPLTARAAALLDTSRKQATLTALRGDWRGLALTLDAPATLRFADGLAVDRLSAHLGKGAIRLAGGITPVLALTASASGIALADFRSFLPDLGAQGTLSGAAELHGNLDAPQGRITLRGQGLRAAFTPAGSPPGAASVEASLMGDHATIEARADACTNVHLILTGTAPLKADGPMALHVVGKADLALLNAVTAASGRRVRGILTLDGEATGTLAAPRIAGQANLTGGEIQDFAQGVRMDAIAATVTVDGARLNLKQLTAKAGPGMLSASGSIDLLAPDMPIDMRMEAKNARPITSDLLTASLTGTMTLTGHVKTGTTLAGKIQIPGAEINLPENLPADVAVLNVRRRGQPPPSAPPRQGRMQLDLSVRTTGPVFVRGHGMDADMGGAIQVTGAIGAPVIAGGFQMNRGTYSLAGQTLDFTSGRIRFDGTGLRGRLDPALDFTAQTVSGGVTATLTVTGYASQPRIALSSTPQLPQDEVVAHLLFQQSVKQLTPLQLASIAQAAAAMGGIGGGFNPLGVVRRTLGLDRLSVGSAQGGADGTQSQTTVEAGRYVTRNVYVGVKQNLSGGTQTQVQADITRRLKAQATLSAGASTVTAQGNALQDNGSSVGLSYQFEY